MKLELFFSWLETPHLVRLHLLVNVFIGVKLFVLLCMPVVNQIRVYFLWSACFFFLFLLNNHLGWYPLLLMWILVGSLFGVARFIGLIFQFTAQLRKVRQLWERNLLWGVDFLLLPFFLGLALEMLDAVNHCLLFLLVSDLVNVRHVRLRLLVVLLLIMLGIIFIAFLSYYIWFTHLFTLIFCHRKILHIWQSDHLSLHK